MERGEGRGLRHERGVAELQHEGVRVDQSAGRKSYSTRSLGSQITVRSTTISVKRVEFRDMGRDIVRK